MTVVCRICAPAVAEIVITYCPGAADEVAETLRIELKVGVPDVGFSEVDIPFGTPVALRAMFWVVPATRFTWMP